MSALPPKADIRKRPGRLFVWHAACFVTFLSRETEKDGGAMKNKLEEDIPLAVTDILIGIALVLAVSLFAASV